MAGIAAIRDMPPKNAYMNTAVQGVELRVLSAIAMQTVVEDLGPKFERVRKQARDRVRDNGAGH